MENPKCCFCGKECENQWGNNPWPLAKDEETKCCSDCNALYVIPARMLNLDDIEKVKEYVRETEEK